LIETSELERMLEDRMLSRDGDSCFNFLTHFFSTSIVPLKNSNSQAK